MCIVSLILKNKVVNYFFLISFLLLTNLLYSQQQQGRFAIPIFTPPATTEQDSQTTSQQKQPFEMDKEYIPPKYPVIFTGLTVGLSYFNIIPLVSNTLPDWSGIEACGGAFFDIRFSKRIAIKLSYEYQFAYNLLLEEDPHKKFHLINAIFKYILAYKHQLWIGLGASLHILDQFAHPDLNNALVIANIITDKNIETEKNVLVFLTIYAGYMFEFSKTIVFDVQLSYGLLNTRLRDWRYNSFRINLGIGFKL